MRHNVIYHYSNVQLNLIFQKERDLIIDFHQLDMYDERNSYMDKMEIFESSRSIIINCEVFKEYNPNAVACEIFTGLSKSAHYWLD